MNMLGIIGGTTWHSTLEYYRLINEAVVNELGGRNSATLLVHSLNFADLYDLQKAKGRHALGELVAQVARDLAGYGAQGILLGANTLHLHAGLIERTAAVPVIHIADSVLNEARRLSYTSLLLLGTSVTMEEDIYFSRAHKHGMDLIVPAEKERMILNSMILDELSVGKFSAGNQGKVLQLIAEGAEKGAQAAILACTELPILLRNMNPGIPVIDTLAIHAMAAAAFITRELEQVAS